MDSRNETYSRQCRLLDESYFHALYRAFVDAFADYVLPFDLSEQQFRNHILLNAVDLESSVGIIEDDKLIGFTLNGFGEWNGRRTVYDAGTGVLPAFRRQGLGRQMFEIMLPLFKARAIRQYLLEVVTTNTNALELYRKLDFTPGRTLSLLECTLPAQAVPEVDGIELRMVEAPDWTHLQTFSDGEPSWQNSIAAIGRSRMNKRFIGAFSGEGCVGYIVYSTNFGRVAQLAVAHRFRRLGIGTRLLQRMISDMHDGYIAQVVNIDRSIDAAMNFFASRGFTEKLSQYEMLRRI